MKILSKLLLLVFTLILILFSASLFLIRFKPHSLVGEMLYNKAIHYPMIVNLLRLNNPGDNKYLYLTSKSKTIDVNVFDVGGISHDPDLKRWVSETVESTAQKKVNYSETSMTSVEIPYGYSSDDLRQLTEKYKKSSKNPVLYIYYLPSYYQEKPSIAGVVVNRDTIFIFKKSIDKLSEKPQILKDLEKSTFMHEWGHILGLEHLDDPDCIMSEIVDVYDDPYWLDGVSTKYCPETLDSINILRKE